MTSEMRGISLHPGQLYLARKPMILQTILGSCVGATFWSARLGAGALCHGVLPRCPRNVTGIDGHRYVDFSIHYLTERFDAMGARREEVEVKLFGGADVLPVSATSGSKPTVGVMNCQAALETLEKEGLCLVASDLRGLRGRTIQFNTGTGEVLLHRLNELNSFDTSEGDRRQSRKDQRVR